MSKSRVKRCEITATNYKHTDYVCTNCGSMVETDESICPVCGWWELDWTGLNDKELKFIRITADSKEIEVVGVSEKMDINALIQEHIGWFQIINPYNLPRPYCIICDEEGQLKELQTNIIATILNQGLIVGDILIMKEVEGPDGGELALLDQDDMNCLKIHFRAHVGDYEWKLLSGV